MDGRGKGPCLAALGLLLILSACDDLLGIGGSGGARTLYVSHTALVIAPGDTVRIGAVIDPPQSMRYEVPGDRWWSEDESVVLAGPEGLLQGVAPGRTTVWVEAEGKRDSAQVAVRPPDEPPSYRWKAVAVGESHACALSEAGAAYCWGIDMYGEVGQGERGWITATLTPARVVGDRLFEEVTAGTTVSCGLSADASAWCWGFGGRTGREPGSGPRAHIRPTPERVDIQAPVAAIRAGFVHNCLVDADGRGYCWGDNRRGQLGLGHWDLDNPRRPNPIASDLRFYTIQPFGLSTCGLTQDGEAYCWGDNQGGQGGRPEEEPLYNKPRPVTGEFRFQLLGAMGIFGRPCGLEEGGRVLCWSSLGYGLDYPDNEAVRTPVPLSEDPGFERVFSGGPGGAHQVQCGLRSDGTALCWGWNTPEGILGTESVTDTCRIRDERPCNLKPVPVEGDLRFRDLSIGTRSACGVTVEGALYCWGENRHSQLGLGRPDVESTPVPLPVPDPL